MKRRVSSPVANWANWLQTTMVLAEAQAVITMRLWGMAGLWAVAPGENSRMVSEKAEAMTRAATAASAAIATGKDPVKAALKPIRRKTKSNMKRLAKRGPRVR